MSNLGPVLNGAVAMASFVATLFFLRFWRQTQDSFFLFFAFAFGVDAVIRVIIGLGQFSEETEPLIYLARAVSFASIIIAVIRKNRPGRIG
jgi:uncharacterized membrane protein HdeD (DUF308 family)